MTPILLRLCVTVFFLLLAAGGVGLWSFLVAGRSDPGTRVFEIHVILGIVAPIAALGLHCLVFIYFLGTGRWVKEVALAYRIPDDPLPRLTRDLKRRAFPPALFAMLVPIAAAATGAGVQTLAWPWPWHATAAIAALLVNLWAFRIELECVTTNAGVIDEVMKQVDRIRAERGLPTNAEELERLKREES
jgi:hypothetical protein